METRAVKGKVAVLIALIGGVAFVVYSRAEPEPRTLPVHHEERLIALDRVAIEEAYKLQVVALFQSWMKDSAGQPERAQRGVAKAREAFSAAMYSVERRGRSNQ